MMIQSPALRLAVMASGWFSLIPGLNYLGLAQKIEISYAAECT